MFAQTTVATPFASHPNGASFSAAQRRAPQDAPRKDRILIVDDELCIVRTYSKALCNAGYEIHQASDGLAAMQLLAEGPFAAILSDIAMPGMSGIELVHQIRARKLDVPVIFVTGAPCTDQANEAVEDGVLAYLVKPVDLRALVQVVDHAVRLSHLTRIKHEASLPAADSVKLVGERAGLDLAFRRAVATLWCAYQPIVHWSRREVFGFEALMRSDEPTLPGPAALLLAAELLGRLPELGRAVRARVAADIAAAPASQRGATYFVNLHAHDLSDEELFSQSSPLSAFSNRVVLEITERASLDGICDVGCRISALRAMGYRIAVDDVGSGYAGLTAFAQLRPDVVKIDQALVRDVHKDPVRRRLIGALTQVSHDLGMVVIAEGIETVEERDALADLGCEMLQGYLFARPARGLPTVAW